MELMVIIDIVQLRSWNLHGMLLVIRKLQSQINNNKK